MPELLLEVGCEELPATFVRKAYTDLAERLEGLLNEAGLIEAGNQTKVLGTPRRLIVSFSGLKSRQDDSVKEMRGPSLKAAYDAEGNPSNALLGFCRGQGVDPANLRKDDQYVWVDKQIEGVETATLLQELLPKAIRALSFEKSMRWGSSRMRFARPIRWMLAAFGGQEVSFEIEGVRSGTHSHGHRFYSPEAFEATSFDALVAGLRARKVEPDPEVRKSMIVDGAKSVAQGNPDLPEALVEENTFLTEFPTPIRGEFKTDFMHLPASVLVTAMAKHEKMFPVRDGNGELTNSFVFVRNSGEDESVRNGCAWVLNARFNDAKFFFDEDEKFSLDDFLEKTSGIVFQEKLGTVRLRAHRLKMLSSHVAQQTGASAEEVTMAGQAGLYAKADLATGLVSELSSLQGVIGGEYGKRFGLAPDVCSAIGSQYDLSKAKTDTSIRLIVADQLDKLAGYLGVGLAPSGSSDPFALRRAVSVLIDAAWGWHGKMPAYRTLLDEAIRLYQDQQIQLDRDFAATTLEEIFKTRYPAMMSETRHDILEASISDSADEPQLVRFRTQVLAELVTHTKFIQAATRSLNLVSAAVKKGIELPSFDSDETIVQNINSFEGEALLKFLAGPQSKLATVASLTGPELTAFVPQAVSELVSLEDLIHEFFEKNMILVDEANVRDARLALLQRINQTLAIIGDITKIVVEG